MDIEISEENISSKVPSLVQQYLDVDGQTTKGKFFRIITSIRTESLESGGIRRSTTLIIEEKKSDLWFIAYSTGKKQYENTEKGEKEYDNLIKNPTILKEGKSSIVFGYMTGEKKIKIFSFKSGDKKPKQLTEFKVN